jgi:tetratricopeptide (TPR) repeat protein
MKRSVALAVSVLAALFIWSCAGPVPPVPKLAVEGIDTEVRDAVLAAHQQAVAEPASGQASGRLGMVLQANSLNQPAVLAYERAIRLEPKEFAWRYYLALVQQKLSQPEKALDAISAALRIRSAYAPAVLKKGELLFQLGRFQESGATYESLLGQDPTSAEALYGLARVKYAREDVSGAADLYRRACQAYATFGAAYYGLGETARSLGDEAGSAKNFDLAKRYSRDRPPPGDPLLGQVQELATGVSQHLEQADKLARDGKMDEAARLNEKILEREPENLTALLNLLYVAPFVNRLDPQVETLFAKVRQVDPRNPLVYKYYSLVMVRQEKYDAAAAALRKAMERTPDDPELYKWLGQVLERQNRPAEAVKQYQRALAKDPSDGTIQMKLWWTLITHGRGREVIPQLLPVLQVEDSFKSMRLVLLGEAYRTVSDFDKSRQYLEQAQSRVRKEGPPDLLAQIEQELKQLPPRP